MSKTTINIPHSEAKPKLEKQIGEGKALAEKALNILRDTQSHSDDRIRARDSF